MNKKMSTKIFEKGVNSMLTKFTDDTNVGRSTDTCKDKKVV